MADALQELYREIEQLRRRLDRFESGEYISTAATTTLYLGAASLSGASLTTQQLRQAVVFNDGQVDAADFSFVMPPTYGAEYLNVIISLSANISGNAIFNAEIRKSSDKEIVTSALLSRDSITVPIEKLAFTKSVFIVSAATFAVGDVVSLRLFRDGTNAADTLAGDLWLFGVGIYFSRLKETRE